MKQESPIIIFLGILTEAINKFSGDIVVDIADENLEKMKIAFRYA
jgi:hypothetical protein